MARLVVPVLLALWISPGWAGAQPGDAPPPGPGGAEQPKPTAPPPPAQGGPPSHYYVEPPPGGGAAGPPPGAYGQPGGYEPPPPGYYYGPQVVYEPPPPPKPKHRAPKTAFWLGARAGYFIPFGNLWMQQVAPYTYDEVKWSDYASNAPMIELDVGARLGRDYNLFFTWERAMLGTGSKDPMPGGGQDSAESDFYAIGLRFSSDPDKVGFLTEIDLGWRRFRAKFADGSELQLSDAPLEFRIGLGADIRLANMFSLSPMVTLGAGSFGTAEYVAPNGQSSDATQPGDEAAGHGWVTFQLGGHFDIPGGDG